jgi:hypothetical protein
MNGKDHRILFGWIYSIFFIASCFTPIYWRLILSILFLPMLDPDCDVLSPKIHRNWLTLSLLPGIIVWYCWLPAISNYQLEILMALILYPMIHLIGDLGWGKSEKDDFMGTFLISLFPIPKRLNVYATYVWSLSWIGVGFAICYFALSPLI